MRRAQGSFGSAGSSRSLRRTATAVGVGSTAAVARLAENQSLPQRLDTPTREEVKDSIASMACCFCRTTKTFRSLSGHWAKAHGIDVQWVRDYIGVAKDTSFISDETKAIFRERGLRLYDPAKLRQRGGKGSRKLSLFGIAVQRAKLAAIPDKEGQRRRASQASAAKSTKSNTCIICGKTFTRKHAARLKTCSTLCDRERRRRGLRLRIAQGLAAGWVRPATPKDCKNCGKTFYGHRLTCSSECASTIHRNVARARVAHWQLVQRLGRQKRANRPTRYCDQCERVALAKGLCGKHYQASRVRAVS